MDQGGGGAYVTQGIEADPNCAAMVDTPAEQAQVYAGGQPPPQPPSTQPQGRCTALNAIAGSASDDELIGGPFSDRLSGLAGNDLLSGAAGADCLRGQRGNDRVVGGAGRDVLKGGKGDDSLNARDRRRDVVRCGKGEDVARVDRRDRVRGCETLRPAGRKQL
jgi:Ca2+-binding RTX toxin-like protein